MTRDEAVILLKARLQRPNFTNLDALIVLEMKAVQANLETKPFKPWFLLSEDMTISTTSGEDRIPVPVSFLQEYEEGALWRQETDGTWTELQKRFYDNALNTYPGAGIPVVYALDGMYFRLLPSPDAVYSLRMKCWLRDTTLSSNIENDWLKHASGWFLAEVGKKIALYHLKDKLAAAAFAADAAEERRDLYKVHIARMEANYHSPIGGYDN